ncbi:beta-lactamase domain-containing protein [Clostridium aceticum]|uniref:Beta-lactamase domain-containing protein n=1 Tax=Clostridium aceticum TaxID=84022 RepID=A0A0D8I609_9CLOT|nr:ComEC/Rec2 family competence protein [Clostridium aceticum]AKL95841.1 beta-lactamase domain-containing protein [Clostridium aceticum]KJF25457.1 hypothetical protein TZ02_18600 [Clostridium aceticum]
MFFIRRKFPLLLLFILLLVLLIACTVKSKDDYLSIHTIDVGQGDSILIKTPNGRTMLIDGGEPSYGKAVVAYLKKNKVKKIDVLIGTHPHSDHIGGLINVLDHFQIDRFYLPKKEHTSNTFQELLEKAQAKGLKISAATSDISITFDDDITLHFLGPLRDYGDHLNLWSVIVKMDYKEKSFLFTGDLEALGEDDLLATYKKDFLKSQFLKVGHHGSNTSSTEDFLQAIEAKVAVISCGRDNAYGHPHMEVIERLQKRNTAIYRTDLQGSIIVKSDGHKIWSHQQPYNY